MVIFWWLNGVYIILLLFGNPLFTKLYRNSKSSWTNGPCFCGWYKSGDFVGWFSGDEDFLVIFSQGFSKNMIKQIWWNEKMLDNFLDFLVIFWSDISDEPCHNWYSLVFRAITLEEKGWTLASSCKFSGNVLVIGLGFTGVTFFRIFSGLYAGKSEENMVSRKKSGRPFDVYFKSVSIVMGGGFFSPSIYSYNVGPPSYVNVGLDSPQ